MRGHPPCPASVLTLLPASESALTIAALCCVPGGPLAVAWAASLPESKHWITQLKLSSCWIQEGLPSSRVVTSCLALLHYCIAMVASSSIRACSPTHCSGQTPDVGCPTLLVVLEGALDPWQGCPVKFRKQLE
jgi:hypothetical protein